MGSEDINVTDIGILGQKVLKDIVTKTLKIFEVEATKDVTKVVRDALLCMLESEILVYEKRYKTKDTETGEQIEVMKKYALPNMTHPFDVLKPKLEEYTKRGGKVIATGMILPPFETLPWIKKIMPDFNESEKQHLILCDTKNMGFYRTKINEKCTLDDWRRAKPKIEDFLLHLKDAFITDKIIVFCFNKDIHEQLDTWQNEKIAEQPLLKDIILNRDFCLTYYGSEFNSGIALDHRIKIYLGGAQTPSDAFEDAKLLFNMPHDKMRDMDIANRLVNALGRGKDPSGKQPSISIVIGCEMNDSVSERENGDGKTVKGLVNLMDGTTYHEKKEIIQVVTQGSIYCICNKIGYYWFVRQREIKDIHTLPWFIDAIRIATIRWKNRKGFITLYSQIYDHWKQKPGFDLTVNNIKNTIWLNYGLSPDFVEFTHSGIKVIGNKVKIFANDLLACTENEIETTDVTV